MISLVFIVLLFTLKGKVEGQSCTASYVGTASPQCTSLQNPYCIQVSSNVYSCAACASDCDCPVGQYCSQNIWAGKAGTCQTFQAEGQDCVSMNSTILMTTNIPDTYKCADVIRSGGQVVGLDGPSDNKGNFMATCLDGICRACNPFNALSPEATYLLCTQGMQGPRRCMRPGNLVSEAASMWYPSQYYEDPTRVWLAIYFPLSIVVFTTLWMIFCKNRSFTMFHCPKFELPKFKSSPPKDKDKEKVVNYGATDTLPPDWTKYETEQGEPYYHNDKTGETTWDIPSS